MARNPILAIIGILITFSLGIGLGYGYYNFTYGSNVASANPLERLDSAPPVVVPEENNDEIEELPEGVVPDDTTTETGEEELSSEQDKDEAIRGEGEILGEKIAYITIDDGPDPKNTPAILKILDEFEIKASFFVLGIIAEKYPELIEQIYEAGHTIGNHTYNHVYKETYASDASFWESVHKTEDIIYDIIGERIKLIREPGGKFLTDKEMQETVREKGYNLVHWNIDSYDSRNPKPSVDKIVDNVKKQAEKEKIWPAMVILMHEGGAHKNSVEALPEILQHLIDEGFVLKSIEEMDADVMAKLPRA